MQMPARSSVMILNTVLFPGAVLPLRIFETRYREMLRAALAGERMFAIAMQRPGFRAESPCPIACLGLIRASVENPDGTSNLILQGVTRIRLKRIINYKPFRQYRIELLAPTPKESLIVDALRSRVLELAEARARQGISLPLDAFKKAAGEFDSLRTIDRFIESLAQWPDAGQLADLVARLFLQGNPRAQQTVLEAVETERRLKQLVQLLMGEVVRAQAKG
ncbi:MAG: hypothetical protein EXS36_20330 [Pedosphaera sp.]|nr:hypothetical protein [Pedosphaera sp.]